MYTGAREVEVVKALLEAETLGGGDVAEDAAGHVMRKTRKMRRRYEGRGKGNLMQICCDLRRGCL